MWFKKPFVTLSVLSLAALTACEFTRTVKGSFEIDGQTFQYVQTNQENIDLIGDEEDPTNHVFVITFPYGTKQSTYSHDTYREARQQRDAIARKWLKANQSKAQASSQPSDKPSSRPKESSQGD